jgi:hypothetical protein
MYKIYTLTDGDIDNVSFADDLYGANLIWVEDVRALEMDGDHSVEQTVVCLEVEDEDDTEGELIYEHTVEQF